MIRLDCNLEQQRTSGVKCSSFAPESQFAHTHDWFRFRLHGTEKRNAMIVQAKSLHQSFYALAFFRTPTARPQLKVHSARRCLFQFFRSCSYTWPVSVSCQTKESKSNVVSRSRGRYQPRAPVLSCKSSSRVP